MRRRDVIVGLTGAAVSAAAPASKLLPLDEVGYQRLVAAQKGKAVLINFWATWCEPCRAEMPALAKLHAKLRAKGFNLITISADEPEDEPQARAFLAKSGINGPAYLKQAKNDDKFINSIEPKWSGALPATFLYDKAGKKVQSFIGEAEIDTIEAAISKLL